MRALSIFKPLFVSLVLILVIECLQIFSNTNYYPHQNTTAETLVSVALVFVSVSAVLIVFSVITSWVARRLALNLTLPLEIIEVISVTAMGLIYVPAAILIFKKGYLVTFIFFWFTGYGVFPVTIFLLVIFSRIFLARGFNRIFYSLVDIIFKPAVLILVLSVIWLPIFFSMHSSSRANPPDSPVSTSVAKNVEKSRPNIIFITFDSLRVNNMSLYGYNRRTTPFFEEFAKESYDFQAMHSNYFNTTSAVASILTSKYPWTHGLHTWLDHIKIDKDENIMSVLRNNYYTAAIVPSMIQYPEFLGLKGEFDYVDWVMFEFPFSKSMFDFFYRHDISRFAVPIVRHFVHSHNGGIPCAYQDEPFAAAQRFINRQGQQPFFLWLHLWPPHPSKAAPLPFKGTYLSAHQEVESFTGRYPPERQPEIDMMRDRYDERILFLDSSLRGFIDTLKESGHYEDSIIILSSDHGQLYELGYSLVPSPLMHEPLFHIPLLIHLPGQNEGVRVSTLAEQVDLAPTILELTDMPVPEWMEGESLVPYMREPALRTKKTKYSMTLNYDNTKKVRWFTAYRDDYKLVYHMDTEAAILFRIRDAHTRENDLAMKEVAVFTELRRDIKRKIEENSVELNRGYQKDNK